MKKAITLMMLIASLFIFASCGKKTTEEKVEDAAEKVEDAAEKMKDAAGDMADKVEDVVEDATE
jgi:outer membrane lipoprotein-sorting protein